MESHTKRFLRIFLFSSATFLQYLQSSSSSSFSGHTPPFLPSHFFIQGSYSGSLVFSALEEKEQESEFVAVNPARRSHRYERRVTPDKLPLQVEEAPGGGVGGRGGEPTRNAGENRSNAEAPL